MTKLAILFSGIFALVTVYAVATDYRTPEGFYSTPKVKKVKNIRERSIGTAGRRHHGFMHGK